MNLYKQILCYILLILSLGFLAVQIRSRLQPKDALSALIEIAETTSGDKFPYTLKSPKGATIYSVKKPTNEMVSAIDNGLDTLFLIAKGNKYRYTQALQHTDYLIFIANPDRLESKKGDYAPDISVPAKQYAGSKYDENGQVFVAGMVLAFKPNAFIIAEHTQSFERVESAVQFEGEHIVLYHNDRPFYERTADHSKGGGHPILKKE